MDPTTWSKAMRKARGTYGSSQNPMGIMDFPGFFGVKMMDLHVFSCRNDRFPIFPFFCENYELWMFRCSCLFFGEYDGFSWVFW